MTPPRPDPAPGAPGATTSETPTRAAVIIPVRDRRDLLAECLQSLDAQTLSGFEVIVVDDGSSDGSDDQARRTRVRGAPVRVLRTTDETGRGAVAARRVGVEGSTADVVAFIDSDCRADPEWLQRCVAAIEAGADLVNGRTVPARPPGPLERSMGSGPEGLYPTCNVAYRRTAYDRAGGFDPGAADRLRFRVNGRARGLGFGEDTMLAWRVRRSGAAVFEPRALVRHHVWPEDWADSASRAWMMGAFPALVRAVPELRQTLLRRRVQLGPTTRAPAYAVLGALVVGRWRAAAMMLAAWIGVRTLAARRVAGSWPDAARTAPAEVAVETIAAVALVVGSIRSRSLVL